MPRLTTFFDVDSRIIAAACFGQHFAVLKGVRPEDLQPSTWPGPVQVPARSTRTQIQRAVRNHHRKTAGFWIAVGMAACAVCAAIGYTIAL